MKFAQAILLGQVASTTASDPVPSAPVWAKTFTQSFNETVISKNVTKETTGMYFYDVSDANNTMTRIDRSNGQWNVFCAPTPTGQADKCSEFVVKGEKYIYYPLQDDCCYCCSAEKGCGALSPDWMKDGTYVGEK